MKLKIAQKQKNIFMIVVVVLIVLSVGFVSDSLETSVLKTHCEEGNYLLTAAVPEPDTLSQNCETLEYVWTYNVVKGGEFDLSFILGEGGYSNVIPVSFVDDWGNSDGIGWYKTSNDALMSVQVFESTEYRFLVGDEEVIVRLLLE